MPAMPLDALAPDQRAVVQLVLQRGRSYEQIAELLKISEDAVRARAHAGLSTLAGDVELPADKVARIADYLLGQQNGKPHEETVALLAGNDAAREWAETVREGLEAVGTVSELPAAAATTERPAPRPRPQRQPRPRTRPVGHTEPEGAAAAASSRLGGALLIGGGVLAIVAVVLLLFVFNGGDDEPENTSAGATPTASATPQAVGQVELDGTGKASKARGVFALFLQGRQELLFAVQVEDMPATPKGSKYALWLTGPGNRAKWIGDTPDVGKDGVLLVQGPRDQDKTFTKDIGTYRRVLVTQERGSDRKQPGTTLARGTLQRGS
jgi:Sigma-70, region 4